MPRIAIGRLVDPKAPPVVGDAPGLVELLDDEIELRQLLLRDARRDDALAVAYRGAMDLLPRLRSLPLFQALGELRLVERRIHQLKELIHG